MSEVHPAYKPCRVCGEIKHRQLEFNKDKSKKDGRRNLCKPCQAIIYKLYRMKPGISEKIAKIQKRYRRRKIVKEQIAWSKKLWNRDNPEKVRGYLQQQRKRYPERFREYNRRYRKSSPPTS